MHVLIRRAGHWWRSAWRRADDILLPDGERHQVVRAPVQKTAGLPPDSGRTAPFGVAEGGLSPQGLKGNVVRAPVQRTGGLLLALLLPIFAIAPLVLHGGLPNTADGIIHLLRQVDFDRAFRAGALVPRWGADLYGGFGYPLYIFAPPLFAYGVEAFFLPGLTMDDALKLVTIASLVLYSLGMFLFMRPKVGRWGALATAALNLYAPLRMREALVTGGNYPQFLAMALFPLVLWAFDGLLRTRQRRWVVIAGLCSAALVLSHLFHAMIFVPVAAGYVLLRLVTQRMPRQLSAMLPAGGQPASSAGFADSPNDLAALPPTAFMPPTPSANLTARTAGRTAEPSDESLQPGDGPSHMDRAAVPTAAIRPPAHLAGLAEAPFNRVTLLQAVRPLLAAGLLALLFSAFFWLPTLAERSLTRTAAEIYVKNSDYHQRFLSWPRLLAPPLPLDFAEANADVPLSLGWAQLAAAALGAATLLWTAARTRGARLVAEPLFWLAVLAASIYLQLPASTPIWENVPLLPVAEFPWRFMGLSAFALAVLGGYAGKEDAPVMSVRAGPAPAQASDESPPVSWRAMLVSTLIILAAVVTAFPYTYTPRGFVQLGTPGPATVLSYERATGAFGLTTINEYLPQTVLELPKDLPAAISRPKIDLPAAALRSAQWSPLGESDSVTLAQPTDVRFRTFNYPGWSVRVDGNPAPLTTLRDGTFTLAVPAGDHQLSARFDETPLRLAASLISLVAVLGLIAMGMWQFVTGKRATNVSLGHPGVTAVGVPAAGGSAAGRSGAIRRSGLEAPTLTGSAYMAEVVTAGERGDSVGGPGRNGAHRGFYATFALCLLLLTLFLAKTFGIDPQGLLRISRFGQALAVFDGQMELIGGGSDEGTVTRGEDMHARFFWRPVQPLATNYHVFAQLIDAHGNAIAGSDKQHPGDPVVQGETPTSQIAPGTYLRDEHIIHVPSDAPPGRYDLKVGLYDPQTGKRLKLPSGESMAAVAVVVVR